MLTNRIKRMANAFEAFLQEKIDGGMNRRGALRSLAKQLPKNYVAYRAEAFERSMKEMIEEGTARREAILSLGKRCPKQHAAYVEALNMGPAEAADTTAAAKEFQDLIDAEIEGGKGRREATQLLAIREPVLFLAWMKLQRKGR